MQAFDEMIAKDSFPMYALFIDLDPSQLDINVHPTKQEIKFEDEKIIYAFVQSAVKHALAQFSITPALDFDLDASIQQLDAVSKPFTDESKSSAVSSSLYHTFTQKNQSHFIESKSGLKDWKEFYQPVGSKPAAGSQQSFIDKGLPSAGQRPTINDQRSATNDQRSTFNDQPSSFFQLNNTFIVSPGTRGYLLIHQQNAHERVLYERYRAAVNGKTVATQQSLFPATLELAAADAVILQELLPDLQLMGYQLEPFGKNSFVIQGTPADVEQGNEKMAIEKMLEQYKHFSADLKFDRREKLIRSLALQQAVKAGLALDPSEIQMLVESLFACETPNVTANGKPTFLEFKYDDLGKLFGR